MIATITGALLPMLFMLTLDYGAGRAHAFARDAVAVITTLVLDFALPASLFVSTVTVSREALFSEGPLAFSSLLVVALTWTIVFIVGRRVFHHGIQEASLQALVIALAAVPFYGLAVMTGLSGSSAGIIVSIGSIIVNLIAVPATTIAFLVGKDSGKARGQVRQSLTHILAGAFRKTAKTPTSSLRSSAWRSFSLGCACPRS